MSEYIDLKIDPEFDSLMPDLAEDEYKGLESSLVGEGCRDPLVVWNGIILDGHNRYKICTKHNIIFKIVTQNLSSREEAMVWIIDNQIHRRNLNAFQRGELALKKESIIRLKAKENEIKAGKLFGKGHKNIDPKGCPILDNPIEAIDTKKELAELAKVSHGTMGKIQKIAEKATEDQKHELREGKASINEVYKQIRTTERREERMQNILELSTQETEDLDSLGKFPIILADPPWEYEHSYTDSRRVDNQYPTMSLEQLKEMDIESISCEDCLLFLWVVNPKVEEAIELINAWGFIYRTNFVWIKDKIGMGVYGRQRHELLFIARKGNIPVPMPEDRPDSVIEAPRTEHSKKPEQAYEYIERMYPDLPKLEMFARTKRAGWFAWGNEVEAQLQGNS